MDSLRSCLFGFFVISAVPVQLACTDGERTDEPSDAPDLPHPRATPAEVEDSRPAGSATSSGDPTTSDPWRAAAAEWEPWLPQECPDLMISSDPRTGVPPILWEACRGGAAGCQQLAITWEFDPIPFWAANVAEANDEVVLGLTVFSRSPADRQLQWRFFATADGTPLASWSFENRQQPGCGGVAMLATDGHFALGLGRSAMAPDKSIGFVPVLAAEDARRLKAQLAMSANGNFDLTDHLVTGRDLGGRLFAYDLDSSQETEIELPNGAVHMASPHEDSVLMTRLSRDGEREILDGWVWRAADGASQLVTTEHPLFDFASDGTFLVWTESVGERALEWNDVDVWRSPLTFDASKVAGQRLVRIPNTRASRGYGRAQNGYYAVIEGDLSYTDGGTTLHVIRLSDGQHREVRAPEGMEAGPALYISSEEIWYAAFEDRVYSTVVRQQIAKL